MKDQLQQRMIKLLQQLAPLEGYNLSPLPDVRFLRSNRPLQRTPVLYDPGIVIVCQGRKRGYWGGELYVYDEQHYLAVSVPVPFDMETDASQEEPLLAIYLHLDFKLATELMLQLDQYEDISSAMPKGMYSSPMEEILRESVLRFLEAMCSPVEGNILGRSLVQEIYYRILTGAQGGSLRAALRKHGHFGKISKSIRKIHVAFDQTLDVTQLAKEAHMSVPTFHAHFKEVTNTSPIQYLKSVRLHQARILMFRNSIGAAAAAAQVGYDSPSQFSRDFKKLFGLSPSQEIKRMTQSFALPASTSPSPFVSSH